jgi:sugar (pentulose or hexulose) kinase
VNKKDAAGNRLTVAQIEKAFKNMTARSRAVDDFFHRVSYEPSVGRDGTVEHDPRRRLDAVVACVDAIHARGHAREIPAVGVTTFWPGHLGVDRAARPATSASRWGDTRSAPVARLLRSALDEDALHARTGCHPHRV